MTIVLFVSGLFVAGMAFLIGKYTLMVSLFIKSTWVLLLAAGGVLLLFLFRKYRLSKHTAPVLPAPSGE